MIKFNKGVFYMSVSKRKNSNSTMINIRIPNFILSDLKEVQEFLRFNSLSKFILFTMSAEILKYTKVIYKNENF